jgi:hypothetical protein
LTLLQPPQLVTLETTVFKRRSKAYIVRAACVVTATPL